MRGLLRQAEQYSYRFAGECPPGQVCDSSGDVVNAFNSPDFKSTQTNYVTPNSKGKTDAPGSMLGDVPGTSSSSGGLGNSVGGGGGSGHNWGPGTSSGGHTEDTGGSLRPETQSTLDYINKNYPQFNDIGGYRPPDGYNEHSSGSALDVMLPKGYDTSQSSAFMDDVFKNNPSADYILYNQTQWNRDGTSSPMEDRGSDTANHRDHFHVHTGDRYAY